MIFLVLLVILVIGGLGYQKYLGTKALTFTHVDVTGLSLDEIIAVVGKAAGSLTGRLTGNVPSVRRNGDAAEWQAQIQGSVMAFSAEPLPGGGYRVGGAAVKMRVAQVRFGPDQGLWGLSKAMSNAIYRLLGIPHNSSALVRRRKRVLNAVSCAGIVIESATMRSAIPENPQR
jgi:hypothetical protein